MTLAALLAQRKQAVHDAEVVAVTTILHDIGLAESLDGPLRFEVENANAARSFVRNEGVDDRRAQLINLAFQSREWSSEAKAYSLTERKMSVWVARDAFDH